MAPSSKQPDSRLADSRLADSRLARLLDFERKAQERYERLAGFPDDVREAAHALWQEAAEAVQAYRARWLAERD
jgi:hypothetical protein